MTREIKFRAWNKKNSKMVYQTQYAFLFTKNGITVDKYNSYNDYDGLMAIDEPTIMQFTGLLDKNGKEIWEGDVLAYDDKESEYVDVGFGEHNGVKVAERDTRHFFPVEFKNAEFGLNIQTHNTGEVQDDGWFSLSTLINLEGLKLEIIGNIYENPELLK